MEWHLRECGELKDHESLGDSSKYISREVLINRLKKRYNMEEKFGQSKPLILPGSKAKVGVVCHDARDCVVSLLTDPRLNDEDYLFFNNNPFAPPPEELSYLKDINTGLAYIETYKKLITKPNRQILLPIPLYIDGAVTGQFDKLEVTALKMSLGIFNRRYRDREFAWKTLGYVSNYAKTMSRGKNILIQSDHVAAQNYMVDVEEGEDEDIVKEEKQSAVDLHAMLDVILESYRQLEKEGMVWDLYYGGRLYKDVEFIFFIPFVKCDTDEADKLCHKFTSRGHKVRNLCRYCLCPTEDTDNVKANYPYKTEPMIKKLVDKKDVEGLRAMSQQPFPNAFHGLRFGLHNKRGIHGACVFELLHAMLLGTYMRIRDCFFEQIGKTSVPAKDINALAKMYGQLYTHQSDRDMPRTNFANGIFKGKLMAKEYSGVILIMATIIRSTEGRRILKSSKNGNFRDEWLLEDWTLLTETMLQWEAYLKCDEMKKSHVKRLDKKHRVIMYLMKKVARRTRGMGMKLVKFHCITHLCADILSFGVPMVVDTGSNESHHKLTKIAAKLTQKDISKFEQQTSDRLDEFHLLDLAMAEIEGRCLWEYFDGYFDHDTTEVLPEDRMNVDHLDGDLAVNLDKINDANEDKKGDRDDEIVTRGMTIQVGYDEDTGEPKMKLLTKMKNKEAVGLETALITYLAELQEDLLDEAGLLIIKTEHKRKGQIFRAHPRYRGQAWNDWVVVDWGPHGKLPCEIWCFIDLSKLHKSVRLEDGMLINPGVYAVVESSFLSNDESEIGLSDIFRPIIKEMDQTDPDQWKHRYYLATVDAFVEGCVVVPDIGCVNICQYFWVKPRHMWSTDFVKWLESPHTNDDTISDSEDDKEDGDDDKDDGDEGEEKDEGGQKNDTTEEKESPSSGEESVSASEKSGIDDEETDKEDGEATSDDGD